MKKWIIYILALAVLPVLSFGGLGGEDVGKLYPVQVVMLRAKGYGVQIVTDGGQTGWGEDVATAIKDLNETSADRIFLDTADYLLLEPGMEDHLTLLEEYLRPSCSLCYVYDPINMEEVAQYLQLHEPKLTLCQYEAGEKQLSTLISDEGRMRLVRP